MIPQYTDIERFFSINSEDGLITTMKPLDRETQAWHNISVSATEIGTHKQQALPTIGGSWDWIWRAWALKTSNSVCDSLWSCFHAQTYYVKKKVTQQPPDCHCSFIFSHFLQRVKLQSVSVWSGLLKTINCKARRENVKMREKMENFLPAGLSAVSDAQLFSSSSAKIVHWCIHQLMWCTEVNMEL